MSRPSSALSQLDTPALLTLHNTLAQQSGAPTVKAWHGSRMSLIERVSILRTMPKAPPAMEKRHAPPRAQPIRRVMLKALEVVSHYEAKATGVKISKQAAKSYPRESLLSVGLPYREVLARVLAKMPHARTSIITLRVAAAAVRNNERGFENCKLPQKRPHNSTRKDTK